VKPTQLETGRWVWEIPGKGKVSDIDFQEQIAVLKSAFKEGGDYLGSAGRAEHIDALNPDSTEITFVGRSNVGKSCLLNAVTNSTPHKSGAQVSKRAGRTRVMHIFGVGRDNSKLQRRSLNRFRTVLVDLPGYGYADASSALASSMAKVVDSYLSKRHHTQLAKAFLLVDAKVGLNSNDLQMFEYLEHMRCPYQIVVTKCDKVTEDQLDFNLSQFINELQKPEYTIVSPRVLGCSSKRRKKSNLRPDSRYFLTQDGGIDRIRSEILNIAKYHDISMELRTRSALHHL